MADIDVPFNFDPVDNLETSSSYTVGSGSGDYAIMSVTLSATASGNITAATNISGSSGGTSTSNGTTMTLRLKAGSVVTKTETAASSSASTTGTQTGLVQASSVSVAQVLVDSVVVGTIRAGATAWFIDTDNSIGNNGTATVTGTADVDWHIAEYNSIS